MFIVISVEDSNIEYIQTYAGLRLAYRDFQRLIREKYGNGKMGEAWKNKQYKGIYIKYIKNPGTKEEKNIKLLTGQEITLKEYTDIMVKNGAWRPVGRMNYLLDRGYVDINGKETVKGKLRREKRLAEPLGH